MVYEECDINNLDKLNILVGEVTIDNSSTISKVQIAKDQFINSLPESKTEYYYIILEYPNKDEAQNSDRGQSFNGEIKIEASEANTDITIMAAYIENDEGVYEETTEIPKNSRYILNEEKSICSNDAIPTWNRYTQRFILDNLTKSGTSCALYFEIDKSQSIDTLAKLNLTPNNTEEGCPLIDATTGNVAAITNATSDGLLCEGQDDYGTTFYFRGKDALINNWVQIGDTYWRIIRINGNGTIRLIYNGKSISDNGYIASTQYNTDNKDNAYVGFMYGDTNQSGDGAYDRTHANKNKSNILKELDKWYEGTTISANAKQYIDGATGFCNDRTPYDYLTKLDFKLSIIDKETGGYGVLQSYYGSYVRFQLKKPSFKCPQNNDLFTTKESENGNGALDNPIGLITLDEVTYAGSSSSNQWLNKASPNYWTMSPNVYTSNSTFGASIFYVGSGSTINNNSVNLSNSVRPVINLKANTPFIEGGDGTSGNPFAVKLN